MPLQNPALTTEYVQDLVQTANQTGAATAAILELDLVIKRLETYITDAWHQALLAPAAAASLPAPTDAPDRHQAKDNGHRQHPALLHPGSIRWGTVQRSDSPHGKELQAGRLRQMQEVGPQLQRPLQPAPAVAGAGRVLRPHRHLGQRPLRINNAGLQGLEPPALPAP